MVKPYLTIIYSIRDSASRLRYRAETGSGIAGLAKQITAILCHSSSRHLFGLAAPLLVCPAAFARL
jgi:hypothetical protein